MQQLKVTEGYWVSSIFICVMWSQNLAPPSRMEKLFLGHDSSLSYELFIKVVFFIEEKVHS